MKERFIGINSIREWSSDDQPREKLQLKGASVLSDAELIAILLGTGTKNKNAVDLARELLKQTDGNLFDFGKLDLESFCSVKGIGMSKAITLQAAFELGRRREMRNKSESKKIHSSQLAYQLVKPYFQESDVEKVFVILLHVSNVLISIEQIAVGGLNMVTVDPKVIFKLAIDKRATNIILCHNHPSGNLSPSNSDRQLTQRIKECAELMSMNIIDHLIVTDASFFSFADNSLL